MTVPKLDHMLAIFVDSASAGQFTTDLTLATGGVVVSGTPISETDFLERLGELLSSSLARGGNAVAGDAILQVFSEMGEKRQTKFEQRTRQITERVERIRAGEEQPSEEAAEALSAVYVHLKDATIFGGGERLADAPLWRGRLSEVAGWTIGRLERTY